MLLWLKQQKEWPPSDKYWIYWQHCVHDHVHVYRTAHGSSSAPCNLSRKHTFQFHLSVASMLTQWNSKWNPTIKHYSFWPANSFVPFFFHTVLSQLLPSHSEAALQLKRKRGSRTAFNRGSRTALNRGSCTALNRGSHTALQVPPFPHKHFIRPPSGPVLTGGMHYDFNPTPV